MRQIQSLQKGKASLNTGQGQILTELLPFIALGLGFTGPSIPIHVLPSSSLPLLAYTKIGISSIQRIKLENYCEIKVVNV